MIVRRFEWLGDLSPLDFPAFAFSAFSAVAFLLYLSSSFEQFTVLATLATAAFAVAIIFLIYWGHKAFRRSRAKFFIAASVALIAAVVVSHPHSAMFSPGRDPGVYHTMAILLSNGGTFESDDITTSTWLGFRPSGDRFVPTHSTGYPVFLGWGHHVLGDTGLREVNTVLLVFSVALLLASVWTIKPSTILGYSAVALFLTNYMTVWFVKGTFSENLQLPVLLLFSFVLLRKPAAPTASLLTIPPSLMLFLSRSDGILFVGTFVCVALVVYGRVSIRRLLAFAGGIISLALTLHITEIRRLPETGTVPFMQGVTDFLDPSRTSYPTAYLVVSFNAVLLVGLLPLALPLILLRSKKGIGRLVALLAPSILYLSFPVIAPDFPWMMRHLWPILPIAVIIFVALSQDFSLRGRRLFGAMVALVVISQILVSLPVWSLVEDKDTKEDWAALLSDLPENAVLLLPPGSLGTSAPQITLELGVRALQLPTSFPWLNRFPEFDFLDPANFSRYVNVSSESGYVAFATNWISSPFSGFFFRSDLEEIKSGIVRFNRIQQECDILRSVTDPQNESNVNLEFVNESCDGLPQRAQEGRALVRLYRVKSYESLAFFQKSPHARFSEGWTLSNGSAEGVKGDSVVFKDAGQYRVTGTSAAATTAHDGRPIPIPEGEFEFCAGGQVMFEGPILVHRIARGGC